MIFFISKVFFYYGLLIFNGLLFWFEKNLCSNCSNRQFFFVKNKFPSRMGCEVIEPMEEKSRLLRVSLFIPRISPSFLSEITGPCSSCALRQISELLDAVRHQPESPGAGTGQPVFPPLHALTSESAFLESSRKNQTNVGHPMPM